MPIVSQGGLAHVLDGVRSRVIVEPERVGLERGASEHPVASFTSFSPATATQCEMLESLRAPWNRQPRRLGGEGRLAI